MNMKKTICLILALIMLLSLIPLAASAGGADLGMPSLNGAAYQPMTTSQKMLDIFEGFSAEPYWDVNQWSVGYGSACGTDPGNKPDIRVTEAEAEQMLMDLLENNYAKTVNDYCKRIGKQPSQNQFDALVDFTYNLGSSWTSGSRLSTWIKNPTTEIDLVEAMGVWSRVSGSISYNHVMRRIREAVVFLHGEYSLPYGNCSSSSLSVVPDRSLPYYKAVIFSANGGSFGSKADTVRFYETGSSYGSFPEAELSEHTLSGYQVVAVNNRKVETPYMISEDAAVENNLKLEAVWDELEPETTEPETTEAPTETEATEPETTEPEVTEPETTEPETTEPAATEPEVTEPATTEPEVTEPAATEPEVTEPATTEPEVTEPVATEPEATEPATTEPEPTKPAPTEPEPTKPAPTEPEPTKPAPTEPEATKPAPTEPEATKPAPTEPKPTKPAPTEPEATKPAPTEPEPTKPAPTEPKPTKPAPTEPEATNPAATEPEVTEPEVTEPAPNEPEVTEPETSSDVPFRDVGRNDWFYEPVAFVYANGYMAGTSTTTFSPQMAMSRAMLVQVLYRIAGSPAVTDEQRACFIDTQNAYYTDAVAWAKANGIVCGVSEDRFAPDQMVTRQDAVLIFYQYCVNYLGLDGTANADLSRFVDTNRVSGYAQTAMEWAVSRNLISGAATSNGLALNPRGNLTRAESATILKAFVSGILN